MQKCLGLSAKSTQMCIGYPHSTEIKKCVFIVRQIGAPNLKVGTVVLRTLKKNVRHTTYLLISVSIARNCMQAITRKFPKRRESNHLHNVLKYPLSSLPKIDNDHPCEKRGCHIKNKPWGDFSWQPPLTGRVFSISRKNWSATLQSG